MNSFNKKRVFIIGVTGYIGGSIAVKLLEKGFCVYGLVRHVEDIERVMNLGVKPVHTKLDGNSEGYAILQEVEIVINAADSDDTFLVAFILEALKGTGKMYIHTSGGGIVGDKAEGKYPSTKIYADIPQFPLLERKGRVVIDKEVVGYSKKGIYTIVICPTLVYGIGKGLKKESSQVPALIKAAEKNNKVVIIGSGANRTSNVHIDDLTDLYVLAIEKANSGSFFFAENGTVSFSEIGYSIISRLGYKQDTIEQISIVDAIALWGPIMAHFGLGSNILVNSDRARKELGWRPKYDNLLQEIASN
ncbi:NAD-dependent epimerase/dehydratase family protein [Sphingobacterium paramultivorum]|uniref:NAD-dependent epimerase/dehydratase family protein n=1 Tax=Sphingobacterium paramultivorum TaxID=2886510 RepID=A0A7G5DZ03_9SPHI|nr:NAD-dependent epimerase/dehydratase family protein [Sphingobacterium paramultivorum]QMV66978.1 NAD-dependent epimerase/dehydratase family protein [Sphingobacterium paramultivorum]WSO15816.1 NAD-dependent epimerase/dehydratase family protein [Sphingobacterium paramultivorum]